MKNTITVLLFLVLLFSISSCSKDTSIPESLENTSPADIPIKPQNIYTNEEFGFTIEFPFEDGDEMVVTQDMQDDEIIVFNITAPKYGIGAIAYIEVLPIGMNERPDYEAMDIPFSYMGANDAFEFV